MESHFVAKLFNLKNDFLEIWKMILVHHFFHPLLSCFLPRLPSFWMLSRLFSPLLHLLSTSSPPLSSHILSTVFHLATGLPFAPGSAAVQCHYSKTPEVSASMVAREASVTERGSFGKEREEVTEGWEGRERRTMEVGGRLTFSTTAYQINGMSV